MTPLSDSQALSSGHLTLPFAPDAVMTIATTLNVTTEMHSGDAQDPAPRSNCPRRVRIRRMIEFVFDEDGATAVEYAVMVALIVAVAIVGVTAMSQATNESFTSSAQAIEDI